MNFTDAETKKLKALARKGVGIDKRADGYKKKIATLETNIRDLNREILSLQQSVKSIAQDRDTWKANYERLWGEVKEFIGAIRSVPNKLRAFIAEHLPTQRKNNREEIQ